MANPDIHVDYYESSKLAKYPVEPYWPEGKLKLSAVKRTGWLERGLSFCTGPHMLNVPYISVPNGTVHVP